MKRTILNKIFITFWLAFGFHLILAQEQYIISTEAGNILIEVFPEQAPVTTANFLQYVERGDFEGASFFRVVRMDNQPNDSIRIEVIQGSFTADENSLPAIPHETTEQSGILHKDGVVSMARSNPGTASNSFFICINDQPSLDYGGMRNPDGQGFSAFGKVVEGMDVVRKIQLGKTDQQRLVKPVIITKISKR